MDDAERDAELRGLRRDLGFTLVVVATLALAIGGNSAILGVAKATFRSKLPFPESERIVRIYGAYRNADGTTSEVTIRGRELNELRAGAAGEGGPYLSMVGMEDVSATLTGVEKPEKLTMLHTTPGLRRRWGYVLRSGGGLVRKKSERGNRAALTVIAYELWQRRFGGEGNIAGQTMNLDSRKYTIVGVMPEGFRFPYDGEVWVPVLTPPDQTTDYGVFARLKPGVTMTSAGAALAPASKALLRDFPDTVIGIPFYTGDTVEQFAGAGRGRVEDAADYRGIFSSAGERERGEFIADAKRVAEERGSDTCGAGGDARRSNWAAIDGRNGAGDFGNSAGGGAGGYCFAVAGFTGAFKFCAATWDTSECAGRRSAWGDGSDRIIHGNCGGIAGGVYDSESGWRIFDAGERAIGEGSERTAKHGCVCGGAIHIGAGVDCGVCADDPKF